LEYLQILKIHTQIKNKNKYRAVVGGEIGRHKGLKIA
jgi:hypothetical protein